MYSLLLLVHLLAVHTLVGGLLLLQVLAVRAARAPAADDLLALWRQAGWLGPRVFIPASGLILTTGLALTSASGYRLDQPYLIAGLLVLLGGALAGPLYHAPESRRVTDLIRTAGAASAEVRWRLRRVFLIARLELGLLILAIVCMVVKPGT